MSTEEMQAEMADRFWTEHEGETDEIELSEAEQAISELQAVMRDIIFSCNEVTLGAQITLAQFAEQIKRKAQAGLGFPS